jgi:hypothetical protein
LSGNGSSQLAQPLSQADSQQLPLAHDSLACAMSQIRPQAPQFWSEVRAV